MSHIPLKRMDYNDSTFITEEECLEFANDVKIEATRQLNDFARKQYTETGIGCLVEDRLSQFIRLGANIDNVDHEDGNTPLIAAVLDENVEMVSMLLFNGADVMAENRDCLNVFDVMACLERETGEVFTDRIKKLLLLAFDAKNSAN
jgi:ankyrin repeat protein